MKKKLSLLALCFGAAIFTASAQETKEKPLTTPKDKVHNVIHPHNKRSHGTKYKTKSAAGQKQVTSVKTDEAMPADTKKKTNSQ
jgi:hypothetical protein